MFHSKMLALCLIASAAWAQDFRATISGTVTDKSGAAIAGAVVRATQRNTNEVKETKTDNTGSYSLPFLQPSTFDVDVAAAGFNKVRRSNIALLVAEKLDLSFQLEVGNVSEQVTVTASAEALQTADASGGVNFDSLMTSEYPLNGRQVYMLMDLSPGVLFTQEQFGASGFSGTRGWDTNGSYVMNGGVQGTNSFSLNGAPISLTGSWQVAPNAEAIQEFKVMVNTYDSAIGRTGGGSVNSTLKSGSNQWHGSLFDYMRNQILDANYTQNNQVGAPRGKHITHQFGGTVGGAIRKNKDFVFFSFEGFREIVPFPVVADVPPLNIRDGQHFTDWKENIFDPLSQHGCTSKVDVPGNCSSPYIRNPFPGNVLPVSRMSAIGKSILSYYPAPNIANQLTQNLVAANSTGRYRYDQPMGRWDRIIGDKDRIYALFTFQHGQEYRNQNGIQNDAAAGNIYSQRTSQNYIADWTRIISSTAVLDVRLSFGRFTSIFPDNAYTSSSLTAKALGMTNMIHAPTSTTEFPPRITFDQFSNLFGSGGNLYTWGSENQWDLAPTVTIAKGKMQWKLGFEFVYAMVPSGNVGRTNGQFTFDRSVTRQYPLVNAGGSTDGSSIADLLLGQPASGFIDWNDTYYRSWPYYAGFVQNDWKIRRNITLNLGLRYDVQVPWVERWDRANSGFDFTVKNPLSDQIIAAWTANKAAYDKNKPTYPYPPVPTAIYGGKTFIQPGASRRTYNTDYSNIQPRVGLAWQFAPKTVLRTGGGIFHRTATQTGYTDGFSQQTTYNASADSGLTYAGLTGAGNGPNSLVNPFPNGITSPSGRALGLLTNIGNGVSYDGAQRPIPRTFQYSFGLQRDFPFGVNIDASYVGSYTNKVPMAYNTDYLSYDTFLQGQKTPASLSTSVPNPFYGIIPKTATFGNSANITIQNLSYPYPLFNGITVQTNPWGFYRFDSLQLRATKRFGGDRSQAGALTTIFSYTFSKNLQSVNRLQNWNLNETPVHELVSYDKPQSVAFSGVWDVPVGKSRHFFNKPNMVVDKIISGWNMNWIYRYTSGIPVGGIDAVFSCPSYLVDNQVHDQWFNNTKSCYKGRASFTLRTMPDRFPWIRQMDNLNMNVAVAKDFRLPFENMVFNLRGEAFNLMNHPLYGAPDTGYTNARFGMLPVAQQNFPRLVQVSMRLRF